PHLHLCLIYRATFHFLIENTATSELYNLSLHDALPIFGDKSYTLRISQLAIESDDLDDEDVELSTKYENRTVKGLRDALRDDKLAEDSRAMIQRNIDRTAAITRAERVEELNSALRVDIDDMIKNEKALVFSDLDVRSIKTGNGAPCFLVGAVEMGDAE